MSNKFKTSQPSFNASTANTARIALFGSSSELITNCVVDIKIHLTALVIIIRECENFHQLKEGEC